MTKPPSLRVAFVAGGLWRGGAEKQLLYMVRALARRGASVHVYCLTRGDEYESALIDAGVPVSWIGRHGSPVIRVAHLARLLASFRPHVVQSSHCFANLYAALGARACGALSIGAIRNDALFELKEHGRWGPWLLRLPNVLLANSSAGRHNARPFRRSLDEIRLLPNVIDLPAFDAVTTSLDLRDGGSGVLVAAVGRLVRAKRFDRFLAALARARQIHPEIHGVLIGDGPEREALQTEATRLGLGDGAVRFIGARSDVPAVIRQADVLALSSDHEGFPNVLLEAMAARLPVVTTTAGDAASVVLPQITGYVVEPDDVEGFARRLVQLAADPAARRTMGLAGRKRVEKVFPQETLADRLLDIYAAFTAEGRSPSWSLEPAPASRLGSVAS